MNNHSIDDLLNKAFALACFILDDRESAIRIVEEAMATLNVKTAAQGKRLYYKPSVALWAQNEKVERYRNKVFFSELHVLQRLIYIAAEVYERRKEQSINSNEDGRRRMLIHFIKHLVRITTRRNSFYVTLGINRLLYNYTTAETMETYSAVIQDPDRVKDDYYYRSRKGVLMHELKKRFGNLIEVVRGPRGEERFQASEAQRSFTDVVRESLSFFTPWNTYCLVPAGINPIMDGIADLSSRGKQDEDRIEVDRLHAVLHPDCHGRLVKSLGLDSPEHRLEVPHFFLAQASSTNGGGSGHKGPNNSDLTINELGEIKGYLHEESARRKKAFAGMLRILVDGHEEARLDLAQAGSMRLSIDDDAELVEVRSFVDGQDLLLATHLLRFSETSSEMQREATSIVLERGQKIAITVSPATDNSKAMIGVDYSETSLRWAATLFLKRWTQSSTAGEQAGGGTWSIARVSALVLALALIVMSAIGIRQFLMGRNASPAEREAITNNRQVDKPGDVKAPVSANNNETSPNAVVTPPAVAAPSDEDQTERKTAKHKNSAQPPATRSSQVAGENEQQPRSTNQGSKDVVARVPDANDTNSIVPERSAANADATRSLPKASTGMSLSEVRKIYVEVRGTAPMAESMRARIIASLSETQRFVPTQSKDDADALLRITTRSVDSATGKVSIGAILINAQGETIWQGAALGGAYTGTTESVAVDTVKGLLGDAQVMEQRH